MKNVINEKLVALMTFLEKSSLVFLFNFKLRNSRSLECRTCVRVSVSLTPIFYYQQPDIELRTMNYQLLQKTNWHQIEKYFIILLCYLLPKYCIFIGFKPKGRLISKQNWRAVNSPKKRTKCTEDSSLSAFCSFVGSSG